MTETDPRRARRRSRGAVGKVGLPAGAVAGQSLRGLQGRSVPPLHPGRGPGCRETSRDPQKLTAAHLAARAVDLTRLVAQAPKWTAKPKAAVRARAIALMDVAEKMFKLIRFDGDLAG